MSDERRALLRITGPEVAQDRVEVTAQKALIAGRLAASDITLKHSKISRNHVRFELTAKGLTITDLGSANGSMVGGQRIDPETPVLLNPGDTVQLGPFTLHFDQILEAGEEPVPDAESQIIDAAARQAIQELAAPPPPIVPPHAPRRLATPPENGKPPEHLLGVPRARSSWLQYIPEIFGDDEFLGRLLLVFESLHAPPQWIIDNFDCYLDAQLAPSEWLQWFGAWTDILVPDSIPPYRQRNIVMELGPLFRARGTVASLSRHLQLVFDVEPKITEPKNRPDTFTVTLPLGKEGDTEENRQLARRVIDCHRPIHTRYDLTIS